VKRDVYEEAEIRPPFALEAFDDPFEDVQQSMARIKRSPFVPYKGEIRGFVFDVGTGGLLEVERQEKAAGV
jgi:carbonic anhydrase